MATVVGRSAPARFLRTPSQLKRRRPVLTIGSLRVRSASRDGPGISPVSWTIRRISPQSGQNQVPYRQTDFAGRISAGKKALPCRRFRALPEANSEEQNSDGARARRADGGQAAGPVRARVLPGRRAEAEHSAKIEAKQTRD